MGLSHVESAPFCQRNIRRWLTLLALSSAAVLGYAIWLATHRDLSRRPHRSHPKAAAAAPALAGPALQPAALTLAPTQFVARQTGPQPAADLQTAFNRAADVIRPAVVNINAVRLGPAPWQPTDPNAARFLDPFDGIPDKRFGNVAYESVGSGVIVDAAGYIVTNDHLVSGASSFFVTRFNQTNEHLAARLVASDPASDLAILKIDSTQPLPTAQFADSSLSEVGDWVLAVGNPFGLGHTVTAGIISARRSAVAIAGVEYRNLLQTDAPINQGSSGGPLVNLNGQVIGINTAIYAPTGVFSGTGFAIPSNRAAAFVARELQRIAPTPLATVALSTVAPSLGLQVVDVTPELAAKLALPGATGVFVSSVVADTPAEDAGFARGDVLVALSGAAVSSRNGLVAQIAALPLGVSVPAVVVRNGRAKVLSLRLRARPPTP